MARLAQARQSACVLIRGPAGSGKTTLAMQWRAQLRPFGHGCAWCMAAAGEDVGTLLDNLFASLAQVDPLIVREAALIHERDGELRGADSVAIPLLNGLIRHGRPLALFFDDFHHVTDPWAHELLQTLIDFAPPHLHIVLVSRTDPPLSLSRLREAGALMELDFADLRFTFSEAEHLLQARDPCIARRDTRLLYDQTGGWGAGLRLASLERGGPAFPAHRPSLQDAGDFVSYFDRQVLSQVPVEELDAIARLSIAHRFNDALAATLLGADAGLALMNRLRRDNLFLLPIDTGSREAWWRFHPMFRDVMRERFTRLAPHVRQQTHSVLGRWLGQRKFLVDAVRHCLAAGEEEEAADWVERHARAMFLAGEMRPLVRAVEMLPAALLDARISLRLWVAWAQLCYRRLSDCRRSIGLLARNSAPGDQDARCQLALLEGSLAIQCEDTQAGEQLIPALESLPASHDAILAGGRRNILGWLRIHQGHFESARALLDAPVLLLEDGIPLMDSAFGALQSRCMVGYSYLREGDMRQAEQLLHEALNAADRALGLFSEAACNAASFLAAVLYEVNQLDSVRALLEPRFNVIERVALPEALVCAALSRIRLSLLERNLQEALSDLDLLDEQIGWRRLVRARGYALAERVRVLLRAGRARDAALSLDQLKQLARRPPESSTAAGREVRALALSAEARWQAAVGEPERALRTLHSLAQSGGYAGQERKLLQLDAHTVLLLERVGRVDEAHRRMESLLVRSRKAGLVRAILDVGAGILDIGCAAREAGVLTPSASFYLDYLKLQHASSGPAAAAEPAADTAHESLSPRELETLRSLALTMSNKRIAQTLGITPETVKWHLKNIYGKLGVYGRDDAVAKARQLGLLQPEPAEALRARR
ncbi:LuxR C-terminal-related transcriptional regulator [Xenophilus azovorans]|uniref:LuxR C-terminal-related transcriptional regulator n=1 Tax=Xenophilus azovorans TaxID=151755 RepID=UPI0005711353|nr:LuxR C-terminal-related transcriptional regulator [Xenophilus azovorans]